MSKLIVIDGPDACGKETQAGLLKENLEKLGKAVDHISFPRYESDESVYIRNYLGGAYGSAPEDVDPKTASMFYALDRYDYFKKNELPEVLICDRYTTSNMIHQGTKFETDEERRAYDKWLEELEYEQMEIPRPDLVFFLDLPYAYSNRLAKARGNEDIHEKDEEHERRAYEVAKKTAEENGWVIIDCLKDGKLKDRDEIAREILERVKSYV